MKRFLSAVVFCFTLSILPGLNAAIVVGPLGAGPITFDTISPITEFATTVLIGTTTTFSDVATIDAAVNALDVTSIPGLKVLATTGTTPPAPFSGGFRRHTTLNALASRPATSGTNAANVLLATLQIEPGAGTDFIVSYDFAVQNPVPGAELPGFYVYYSLSGSPGSWLLIGDLSGKETSANVAAELYFGPSFTGGPLYLLWVDDNAEGITDPSYTIDNFLVTHGDPPPRLEPLPDSVTIRVGRTVSLTVVAHGVGLQYAWHKVGLGLIDAGLNPSAATSTLTITNAALSDTGNYFVIVSNGFGTTQSNPVHVQISPDTFPPQLLTAHVVAPGLNTFRLVVNEPLCEDLAACGALSGNSWNWQIQNAMTFEDLGVVEAVVNGTNIDFSTELARTPGALYRIVVVDEPPSGGVADKLGNFVPLWTFADTRPFVTFQQGVDGYTGTQDTELHSDFLADTPLGSATSITMDNDNSGVAQGLLRFDNIIGTGPDQLPPGSTILSATLIVNQTDPGSIVNFHRMLVAWDEATATWNSMLDGISNDGVEAVITSDALSRNEVPNGPHVLDVTASVQAWAEGQANYGWGIRSTGNGGWDFTSSESATPPLLVIEYRSYCCCIAPSFTSHPVSTTGVEGASASLTAGVTTCGPTTYQWTKNNVNIPGQTGPSLLLVNLTVADNGEYRVRVTNPNGTATSNPATLTVLYDDAPLEVTRAISLNETTIVVTFSKVMGASVTVVAGHYILSPSGLVTAASLSADGRTVTLTTTARNFTTAYSLRIQNVSDNRATPNLIRPNPTIVSPTTVQSILAWNDVTPWLYATNTQDATLTSGTPWYSPAFVPGPEWLSGAGLFGFDDTPATVAALPAPIITPLTPNAVTASPDLFVTTYFRRSITLPPLPSGGQYVLCTIIDDGAIFYLDGVPILANNMPDVSPIQFITRAFGASSEGLVQCFPLNTTSGTHTLAAEVHQAGTGNNSDVLFGVDIRILPSLGPSLNLASALGANTVSWLADASWELTTSLNVAGPYAAQITSSVGQFGFPVPANATNHFYRLRYTGRP
jgi:hypothetical protein